MGYGSKSIGDWAAEVHANARAKGFFEGQLVPGTVTGPPENARVERAVLDPRHIPEKLALIHSELSEALEAYRDDDMRMRVAPSGKPEGFPVEIADAVIRCLDLAESLGFDLEAAIRAKHQYNLTRPAGHGRVRL